MVEVLEFTPHLLQLVSRGHVHLLLDWRVLLVWTPDNITRHLHRDGPAVGRSPVEPPLDILNQEGLQLKHLLLQLLVFILGLERIVLSAVDITLELLDERQVVVDLCTVFFPELLKLLNLFVETAQFSLEVLILEVELGAIGEDSLHNVGLDSLLIARLEHQVGARTREDLLFLLSQFRQIFKLWVLYRLPRQRRSSYLDSSPGLGGSFAKEGSRHGLESSTSLLRGLAEGFLEVRFQLSLHYSLHLLLLADFFFISSHFIHELDLVDQLFLGFFLKIDDGCRGVLRGNGSVLEYLGLLHVLEVDLSWLNGIGRDGDRLRL
mmetsp:Transcript_26197/g.39993  ORF Transcript_26197/g.39993 Transcript_26197/m.39993 type:complete len:321 (+) Transcript_26197:916-1878(+)